MAFMKKGVLLLTDVLHSEGAENVTVNIAVRLKQSDTYYPIVCATRWGGVLEDRLKEHDVKCIKLNRNHRYEIYKFYPLRKLIRDENVAAIHSHKMGSNFWGAVLGRLCNIPAIAHVHGQVYDWKIYAINRFINALCSKIITVSDYEKTGLLRHLPPGKVITVYNGIDPKKYLTKPDYKLKSSMGFKPDTPVIGISAALRREKAHEIFLRAAAEVVKKRKDVRFLIIGDGPRRRELENLTYGLGIARNVIFTGFVKNIQDILSILNVGALTSEREALPLTLLEYMASSKPIVATEVGGVGEVVKNGTNGFLVPRGDYVAFAGRINDLLHNPALASEFGESGRSILKSRFSEDRMMEEILRIYDELTVRRQ